VARLTRRQREIVYPALLENQHGKCANCDIHERDTPGQKLTLDHLDNDRSNNNFNNLQLLCRPDNTSKENRHRTELRMAQLLNGHKKGHTNGHVPQGSSEREREKLSDEGIGLRGVLDYQRGSIEMQANDWYEPVVIQYLAQRVNQDRQADYADTVNAAAELAGCNPTTVKRYLDKKASSVGQYEIVKDPVSKRRIIQLRGQQ
jgi:hypothetical protein